MDNGNLTQLGIGGIFTVMVLNIVFNFLKPFLASKKNSFEMEAKSTSRDNIMATAARVTNIDEFLKDRDDTFFGIKNRIERMDGIIGRRNEQDVPLIYNPGLERAIEKLSTNLERQTESTNQQTAMIGKLMDNCKKKG